MLFLREEFVLRPELTERLEFRPEFFDSVVVRPEVFDKFELRPEVFVDKFELLRNTEIMRKVVVIVGVCFVFGTYIRWHLRTRYTHVNRYFLEKKVRFVTAFDPIKCPKQIR